MTNFFEYMNYFDWVVICFSLLALFLTLLSFSSKNKSFKRDVVIISALSIFVAILGLYSNIKDLNLALSASDPETRERLKEIGYKVSTRPLVLSFVLSTPLMLWSLFRIHLAKKKENNEIED